MKWFIRNRAENNLKAQCGAIGITMCAAAVNLRESFDLAAAKSSGCNT